MIAQYQQEIQALTEKAEQADNKPLADGYRIPEEIARRADRVKALEEARRFMESAYEVQKQKLQAEHEAKMVEREKKKAEGKKLRGKAPQPPSDQPPPKMQHNFTDSESKIMKAGNGNHFEQAYNAQAAVDAEGSPLILGARVTQAPNDKEQMPATVVCVDAAVRKPDAVLVDSGFYSEAAVLEVEQAHQTTVYAAMEKQSHHRTVADLEAKEPPPPLAEGADMADIMRYRLKTPEGQGLYALRKQTIEPVFGIIKEVMGFRRFSLRGLEKVTVEWVLVCLSYNFKRLFNLKMRALSPKKTPRSNVTPQIPMIFSEVEFFASLRRFFHLIVFLFRNLCSFKKLILNPTGC